MKPETLKSLAAAADMSDVILLDSLLRAYATKDMPRFEKLRAEVEKRMKGKEKE